GLPVEPGVRCRPRRPHPLGRPAWGGVPVTAATGETAACEAFGVDVEHAPKPSVSTRVSPTRPQAGWWGVWVSWVGGLLGRVRHHAAGGAGGVGPAGPGGKREL